MKFFLLFLMFFIAAALPAANPVKGEWKPNQPNSNGVVKSLVPGIPDGQRIPAQKKYTGSFKPYQAVEVPHSDKLNFQEGFIAEIDFLYDQKVIGKRTNFANLITKGKDFDRAYCIMAQRDGGLLLNLKGMAPAYKISNVGLVSGKRTKVIVAVGEGKVRIYVNGALKAFYSVSGKLAATAEPLYFGAIDGRRYALTGKIFSVKLFSYDPAKLPAGEFVIHDYRCNDGRGFATVKDYGNLSINGKITDPDATVWAREDDRGWFLHLQNGGWQLPHRAEHAGLTGLKIESCFSCNFDKISDKNFASILTKGDNFQNGYTVMVGRNGELLVYLRGLKPAYKILPLKLQSSRDYDLAVEYSGDRVIIKLDKKIVAEYPVSGTLQVLNQPLNIGSSRDYPFTGNLYRMKISALSGALQNTSISSVTADAEPEDPAGTVIVRDFTKFSPAPIMEGSNVGHPIRWRVRTDAGFMHQTNTVLHPPSNIHNEEFVYDPQLKGKYDVYAGVRAVGDPGIIQIRFGSMENSYYTVRTASSSPKHFNVEVPLDYSVDMTGRDIRIATCGYFYFGYLKFIPSEKRRSVEVLPSPLAFASKKQPRFTREILDRESEEKIAELIRQGYFVERFYVDNKKAPIPSAAAKHRGWYCFDQHWMDMCFANTIPNKEVLKPSFKIHMAKNEYEPFTIGIRALRPVAALTMRVKYAPDNAPSLAITIPATAPRRNTNHVNASEFIVSPDHLENTDTMKLAANTSRQFWITANSKSTPGVYRYILNISDGANSMDVPLEITVNDFELAETKNYDLGFWTYFYTVEDTEKMIATQAKHGMNTIGAWGDVLKFSNIGTKDLKIDFEQSLLPVVAKEFKRNNMSGTLHISCSGLMDAIVKLPRSQWQEVHDRVMKELLDYAEAHDFPPMTFGSYDEVLSNPSELPKYIWQVKRQKAMGLIVNNDHLWYKTSRPYQKQLNEVADLHDIFTIRYNTRNFWYVDTCNEIARTAAARNKKIVAYNSNNALCHTQTEGMRFIYGWFFRTAGKGFSGHMMWAYNYIMGNPYNDLDGNHNESAYDYPPYGPRKGGVTINLAAMREGVDDLRYVLTLENLIKEARSRGISTASAEAVLTDITGSFDEKLFMKKSVYIDSAFEKEFQGRDGKRYASGRYRVPTGWSFEQYDSFRDLIAREIISLKEKLSR